uniref:non-specific serine/threonine protein kinase n=1 Tax=Kalanchoe fedtschenkoi TaxID=63787 RepID=A0A7N0U292_KALFE
MWPELEEYSNSNRFSYFSDDEDNMFGSSSSSTSSTSTTTGCASFRSISADNFSNHSNIKKQEEPQKQLGIQDFRVIKPIGAGDIGKVYLCQLRADESCCYAMKVMDREVLEVKKKTHRAEMEKRTLKLLDHPFLPKLVAQFEASRFSCNVIEYCTGGDLHSLRYRQPHHRFSLPSARFYAAEVLVALEYLHMLGIVYRDLKPENILVRSDGHIMLTDFDLCLLSSSTPTLQSPPTTASSRSSPSCLPKFRCSKRIQTLAPQQQPTFVAEPTSARSSSFVGTHEYVAPEVASGRQHGNAVDWWAFGVFLYEMLYGHTPFAGESNDVTLRNIVKAPLTFPKRAEAVGSAEVRARDLIKGLLNKDAAKRLGSKKGAAEIKSHAFFRGLNFTLIRSSRSPQIPVKELGNARSGRREASITFDCF